MIWPNITTTFGRTPLVQLHRVCADTQARIVAKLESRNPCGSVKDRIGVALVEDAERRGVLKAGGTIVEPTSGNTGIALAFVAASRGYRLFLTMPETMSRERIALLRFLGAQVELTPGALMQAAVERAQAMLGEIPGAIMLNQFRNPANPEVHRRTTAVEVWEDTDGEVDVFVSGVGTGGTITGVGEFLKLRKPGVKIVAVEPAKCAVLSGRPPGNHLIQGIGAGFVPDILNRLIIDEVLTVTEDESFEYARRLAREEGIPAGISSGAALAATLHLARRPGTAGKLFVVMLPDSGERYVTTPLMDELAGRNR